MVLKKFCFKISCPPFPLYRSWVVSVWVFFILGKRRRMDDIEEDRDDDDDDSHNPYEDERVFDR